MSDDTPPPPGIRDALASFSPLVNAGSSIQTCPHSGLPVPQGGKTKAASTLIPSKPCNLVKMKMTEPSGKPQGKVGPRSIEFQRTETRNRRQSPTILRNSTDPFQITATSRGQGTRQIMVTVVQEACCGKTSHRMINVSGPDLYKDYLATQASLVFSRAPMFADEGGMGMGFWAAVNAAWQLSHSSPITYNVTSRACGLPAGAKLAPLAALAGRIEVFPADQYKLALTIPSLLEPSALKYEPKSSNWMTEQEHLDEKARAQADSYYQSNKAFLKEAGVSRADVRDFTGKMAKKASGEDDHDFAGKLKLDFSQTDGERVLKAPIDDAIKLVRCIRSAEYAIKEIDKWIEGASVGPGASLSIACQFFAGSVSAEWGHVEFTDDRVFLGWEAKLSIELIKLELKIAMGWRCAGLADLFIEIGGEGTINLSGSVAARNPDDKPEIKPEVTGELKLSGMVKAQLMWAVKGETGLECSFKAEVGDFHFMRTKSAFAGKIVIAREPVYRVLTYSNRLFGGSTAEKHEVISADPAVAVFEFGA